MSANGNNQSSQTPEKERLAYSIQEAADMLGVDYFSVYRLIQRGKLKACRALRGKFLIARSELLRMLNTQTEAEMRNHSSSVSRENGAEGGMERIAE